jgi:hypothetical protein
MRQRAVLLPNLPSVRSNTEWSPKASASRAKLQRIEEEALQRALCDASGLAAKYSAMAVLAACSARTKRSGISSHRFVVVGAAIAARCPTRERAACERAAHRRGRDAVRRARAPRPPAGAVYMPRARSTRLCASSTSTATRQPASASWWRRARRCRRSSSCSRPPRTSAQRARPPARGSRGRPCAAARPRAARPRHGRASAASRPARAAGRRS